MPAGVAYCSRAAFGSGRGARDWSARSSWTFFIRRTATVLFLDPARGSLARGDAPGRDDCREILGAVPHERHEGFAFEPRELRPELVEAHPAKDLEELVLLQAEGPALGEQREELLPKAAFDGPGLLLLERAVHDLDRECIERVLDELAGPSRREHVRRAERLREIPDVFIGEIAAIDEIFLVHDDGERHVARDLHRGGDPLVQGVQAVLPGDVAHADERLGSVIVRFANQFPEPSLAHDVEDRHVHLDLRVRAVRYFEFDLADARSDRVQVRVLILVQDKPPDERRLADSALANESYLCLHSADRRHRRTGPPGFGR